MKILGDDKILILDDFNTPSFNTSTPDRFGNIINYFKEFQDISQYNNIPNHLNRLLDLVFANLNIQVEKCLTPLVDEDPHHPTLFIKLNIIPNKSTNFCMNHNEKSYNFRRANFPLLYSLIASTDWSSCDSCDDVDIAYTIFQNLLHRAFNASVPKLQVNRSRKAYYPPRFTTEIIRSLHTKNKILKQYKKFKTQYYYQLFSCHRAKIKTLMATAYRRYISNMELVVSSDPKKIWSFIDYKKGRTRIPGSMEFNNVKLESPQSIVNAFGEYFSSVYVKSDPNNLPSTLHLIQNLNLTISYISEDEIIEALKSCKNTMTSGPDGIPSFFLKDCASVLVKPLYLLFNLILRQSSVPSQWKNAAICPIFKKGDKANVENYRQVCLICNFAKVFESIIYKRIYSSVSHLITPVQHGFVQKRSTISNLACLSQFVSKAIDNNSQVDVVYTDFQKAFDQIDHFVLLNKLNALGFSAELLALLKFYLLGRQQYVRYRNYTSSTFSPSSGVPQGSNLGPLLFLLFINDLPEVVTCESLLFADDYKLYAEIKWTEDGEALQENLDAVLRWCNLNRLSLNVSKCNVVTYSRKKQTINYPYNINSVNINRLECIKDLGILFDNQFTFVGHIQDMVKKAFRTYGFIYRNCRDFSDIRTLFLLFFSLVRSRLEYGAIIWFPIYKIHIVFIGSV